MAKTPEILNWISGREEVAAKGGAWLSKNNPHTGALLCKVTDSSKSDVDRAISVAISSFAPWAEFTPIRRGQVLSEIVFEMKRRKNELAECVSLETGKTPEDAQNEVRAALLQAEYWATEGMRLHGRSLTSVVPGRHSHTVRQPLGVAGLIVPANTPIANIAWKVFPALICGNTVVLKAAEDSPCIALLFAKIVKHAGLPDGIFNVIQGRGETAGAALVKDSRVAVISFTGSTRVGRWIAETCGQRLARVSLELGGKNPFIVCDDADLDQAVHWACLSAFSNAGQRCAAGSRILVFESIYTRFRDNFVAKAIGLKLGTATGSDLGPLVNQRQQESVLAFIERAKTEGGRVLCGGIRADEPELTNGYYIRPTIIDGLEPSAELSRTEIFGPVCTLHSVANVHEALALANCSEYGLTAAIHTSNVDRAMWFAQRVRAGLATVNQGTFGSEPHMPFGGFGDSGNGSREPGVEALNVYSELKNISFLTRDHLI